MAIAAAAVVAASGYLASSIGGIFGATQQRRAAQEAQRVINAARAEGRARSQVYESEFSPFVSMSKSYLEESAKGIAESRGYLSRILSETDALDVGEGLSGADRIAYEDAAKLLNEQMVSTGNLRSGAAAFGQSQLLRRVVADANERRFSRQTAKLQLMFGGQQALSGVAGQYQSLAGTSGQIGLYGKQLSSQLLQAAMGLAPAQANMAIAQGNASATGIMAASSTLSSAAKGFDVYQSGQESAAYRDYLKANS